MKDRIGVIVPVYKTEKYVAECIESILAQTYTNFRLILVNDGSPDNAGAICDEYATRDSRITVIHQENAGVTRARARGVEEAHDCEWITFVDSDDTITPDALETMCNYASEYNNEIILTYVKEYTTIEAGTITKEDYLNYLFAEKHIYVAPWGKLFNRVLFDENIFDLPQEIVIGEDLIMNIRLALKTNKNIELIPQEIYNYRTHAQSVFHSHKRTPENEQAIHEYKIRSLPSSAKDKYIAATIPTRILRATEFWWYRYSVKGMKKNVFYTSLYSDINKYKYKLSIIDRLIFTSTNPIVRFFVINIKKLMNKLSLL